MNEHNLLNEIINIELEATYEAVKSRQALLDRIGHHSESNPMINLQQSRSEQSRSEWLKSRKSCIGGSDIAAIMGWSEFKNIHDVYNDKINPDVEDKKSSLAARRGQQLEPLVSEIFQEEEAVDLIHEPYKIYRDKEYDFMGCTVDRRIVYPYLDNSETILEVKTGVGVYAQWDVDVETNETLIPNAYYAQTIWNYHITKQYMDKPLDFCVLAALLDDKYFKFELKANEKMFNEMKEAAADLWLNHIVPRMPPANYPEQEGSNLYREAQPGSIVVATDEIFELAKELSAFKSQRSQMDKDVKWVDERIDTIKDQIQKFMEDKENLLWNDVQVVKYANDKDTIIFDSERFSQEQPELYKAYLKVKKGSRRFTPKYRIIDEFAKLGI